MLLEVINSVKYSICHSACLLLAKTESRDWGIVHDHLL